MLDGHRAIFNPRCVVSGVGGRHRRRRDGRRAARRL